jgi:hypothetical protein
VLDFKVSLDVLSLREAGIKKAKGPMPNLRAFLICRTLALCLFGVACGAAQTRDAGQGATWLWVMDQHTALGVPGASIDIGPGKECLKVEKTSPSVTWTAHYTTGPAGRVLIAGLPQQFSCRVRLDGRELPVESAGGSLSGDPAVATLVVNLDNRVLESVDADYWRTTNDPTKFRDYIQDEEARLIPGVKVRALRSGITAISDANGLFTLEVPASYRKGKSPSTAIETLVFSKSGYRTLEYRDLVLNPDVNRLSIRLERGPGTLVHRNRSISNGEYDSFSFAGEARELPDGYAGEIVSFEIEPSIYNGWTLGQRGAKVILKGRNLRSVEVFLYPMGTGLGEAGPYSGGQMKKVRTSPQGDTWELPLPDVMTTNFWAQAIDANGKSIKSMDLGNVAYGIGFVH